MVILRLPAIRRNNASQTRAGDPATAPPVKEEAMILVLAATIGAAMFGMAARPCAAGRGDVLDALRQPGSCR